MEQQEIIDVKSDEITNFTPEETAIIDAAIAACDEQKIAYSYEDITNLVKEFMSHGKFKLIKDKNQIDSFDSLIDVARTAKENASNMEETMASLTNILDPFKTEDEENTSIEQDVQEITSKSEIDDLSENLEVYAATTKIVFNLVYDSYMKNHAQDSLYVSIVEELNRQRETLAASKNLNAPARLAELEKMLPMIHDVSAETLDDCLKTTVLIFKSLEPKLQNKKQLRNVAKEQISKGAYSFAELTKNKFNVEILIEFSKFFLIEYDFRSTHSTGNAYFTNKELITSSCLFFFYHMQKIIIADRHTLSFDSVLYRLLIAYLADISALYPPEKERFVTDAEDGTQTENSKVRSAIYDIYASILCKYNEVLTDKTLYKYSVSQARKPQKNSPYIPKNQK